MDLNSNNVVSHGLNSLISLTSESCFQTIDRRLRKGTYQNNGIVFNIMVSAGFFRAQQLQHQFTCA